MTEDDTLEKQFTDELERCYRDDPEIRAILDDLMRQLALERGRRYFERSRRALLDALNSHERHQHLRSRRTRPEFHTEHAE